MSLLSSHRRHGKPIHGPMCGYRLHCCLVLATQETGRLLSSATCANELSSKKKGRSTQTYRNGWICPMVDFILCNIRHASLSVICRKGGYCKWNFVTYQKERELREHDFLMMLMIASTSLLILVFWRIGGAVGSDFSKSECDEAFSCFSQIYLGRFDC